MRVSRHSGGFFGGLAVVALAFIPMYLMGMSANIMSLAGIIIAVGDMVE